MIQVLTYAEIGRVFGGKDVVVNIFHNVQSLDDFDINIIDLQNEYLWQNVGSDKTRINKMNDLKNLGRMLNTCDCKNIVILLPQNSIFRYGKKKGEYQYECELKDMIGNMQNILSELYLPLNAILLQYENTYTIFKGKAVKSSFCFNYKNEKDILFTSHKSNKPTVVKYLKVVLSTLLIEGYTDLINLLEEIGMIEKKANIPEWMEEIKMFDDNKQFEIIQKNNNIIKESQSKIDSALKCIEKNNWYKSVLYTNGNELVDVVFEILEEMLGCDLHDFEDKKKEDFSFTSESLIYIGEIKGISSNVKSANISQLEFHHQGFLDDHAEVSDEQVRQILIINHQRDKALGQRDSVDNKQIALAKRYGSLIVETITLLKMFEKYKIGELNRQQCFELFNRTGLLNI